MMSKMILACAGLAVCGSSLGQVRVADEVVELGAKYRAKTATLVTGFTADGMPILGKTIQLDGTSSNSSRGISAAYDSMGTGPDTDGDGFFNPICGGPCEAGDPLVGGSARFSAAAITQNVVDDISIDASFSGAVWDGGLTGFRRNGDCSGANEDLILFISLYESATLNPVGDPAVEGFDNDSDGLNDSPYDINTFIAGAILDFGNIAATAPQWGLLQFDGISTLGITLPTTDLDGDPSTVEGTYEISVLSVADDTDGDGAVDTIAFSSEVFGVLGGTDAADTSGCRAGASLGATGTTTPGLWAEGVNVCGDPLVDTGWSDGGFGADGVSPPAADFFFDLAVDTGIFGASPSGCPDDLVWAHLMLADGGPTAGRLCADVNGNGTIDGSDFFAWVNAFGTTPQTPASIIACDVNNNLVCDGSDFFAWVNFFGTPDPENNTPDDCLPLP